VVAWGDLDSLLRRIHDHLEAGATHVCIQPLGIEDPSKPDLGLLEALAPALP
jgi:hypothetical protein